MKSQPTIKTTYLSVKFDVPKQALASSRKPVCSHDADRTGAEGLSNKYAARKYTACGLMKDETGFAMGYRGFHVRDNQ